MSLNDEFDALVGYLHGQMIGMNEPQRRVYLRDVLKDKNRKLQQLFQQFGMGDGRYIKQFNTEGYQILFHGHTAQSLAGQYGVKEGDVIEYMGDEALQDSVMRATTVEDHLRQRGKGSPVFALTIHRTIANTLRLWLIDHGYALPETLLPASESVESVRKRLAKGGDLFLLDAPTDDPQEGC